MDYTLFLKQHFSSTQLHSCLSFHELSHIYIAIIHIAIITLRYILYLVYLCLCDLFLIFCLIFIVINHLISLKQTHVFSHNFQNSSYYFWMITRMKKATNFQIAKFSLRVFLSFCLIFFAKFKPGVA